MTSTAEFRACLERRGVILDEWGDEWSVDEERLTTHGWPLMLGRPLLPGGRRPRQGKTTILTPELAAHLRAAADAQRPYDVDLPIHRSVVQRLRKLLGLDWYDMRRVWWEDRAEDLADLTLAEFGRRHDVTQSAASLVHKAVFGPRQRPAGWWREADAALHLRSDLPRAYVAHRLGISVGAVGRLRWILRNDMSR